MADRDDGGARRQRRREVDLCGSRRRITLPSGPPHSPVHQESRVAVVQPPHWLAEVAAVIVRLDPERARQTVSLLQALEFPVVAGVEVYQKACELSSVLNQHLFDTLYHAVALTEPGAILVTADD